MKSSAESNYYFLSTIKSNILNSNMYCSYKSTLDPELYSIGQIPRNNKLCKCCANINMHHVEGENNFIMEDYLLDVVNIVNIHRVLEIMSRRKQSIKKKLFVYTCFPQTFHQRSTSRKNYNGLGKVWRESRSRVMHPPKRLRCCCFCIYYRFQF